MLAHLAAELVRAGRVRVAGLVVRNPETWVDPARERVELDGRPVAPRSRCTSS